MLAVLLLLALALKIIVVPDIDDSFVVVCLVAAFYLQDYFHFNFLFLALKCNTFLLGPKPTEIV